MLHFFERYADRVTRGEPDACWEWTGAVASTGYGHTHLKRRQHVYAHRAAYESVHGVGSANGLVVRHTCDNPPCCNPAHLLVGSQSDNMRDCYARNRRSAPNCKLQASQVTAIQGMLAEGRRNRDIAAEFGVNPSTISQIKRGRNWRRFGREVSN